MARSLAFAAVLFCAFACPTLSAEPNYDREELFWGIWQAMSVAAKSCEREDDARNFLETAGMAIGNPDASDTFSDVVEHLAVEKPMCFLSAASSLRSPELKLVVERFLARPTQHSSKDIEESLARYWNQDAFTKFRQLYIDARR